MRSTLRTLPTTSLLGALSRGMMEDMAVNDDCRHYVSRGASEGEITQRCKLGANEALPFACPEGCLFYEPRGIATQGWQI